MPAKGTSGRREHTQDVYQFPGVDPDDHTVGGAIPPDLWDRLHRRQAASEQSEASGETD